MAAATATDWLTAAAIGTSTLPFLAAAVVAAGSDWHLPHMSLDGIETAAKEAALKARLQLAAWLLVIAWHLQTGEAAR